MSSESLVDNQPVLFDTDPSIGVLHTASGRPVYNPGQIIDAAFHHFRKTGFPYRKLPIHICMQEINNLATSDPSVWLNSNLGYHVADTYHPHRFAGHADGMLSPEDAFASDKLLRRTLALDMKFNGSIPDGVPTKLSIVSGTQACSNFRPGFAMYIYKRFCKAGDTVLDTSTGYGGRLVGFIASGIAGAYIGIDPSTATHDGNIRMAADLGVGDKVELHCMPAEDVAPFTERCSFAFTSPPYFSKERYADEPTQSFNRYRTGDEWRKGFLVPMMRLQYHSLKPGSYAVVNIADVKLKGKVYPLVDWTIDAGLTVGFEHIGTEHFGLSKRMGAGQSGVVATEPVLIFKKV